MFDFSWENILHSNLINFLILAGIIFYAVIKIDVSSIIEAKRKKVEECINASESSKNEAVNVLAGAKEKFEHVETEITEITQSAESTLKSLEGKILKDADEQIQKVKNNINKVVDSEKNKVVSELSKNISDISITRSAENLKRKLAEDTELHNRLIEQAIDNLDGVRI